MVGRASMHEIQELVEDYEAKEHSRCAVFYKVRLK